MMIPKEFEEIPECFEISRNTIHWCYLSNKNRFLDFICQQTDTAIQQYISANIAIDDYCLFGSSFLVNMFDQCAFSCVFLAYDHYSLLIKDAAW